MFGVALLVIQLRSLNYISRLNNFYFYVLDNRLIGPFIFSENLSGNRYLLLLQEQIIPAITNSVPPNELRNVWFQQDGCPAHSTRQVMEVLRNTFGDNIISNNGPINWPARSPDITPPDFYLWGYAKNEVYGFSPPENRQELEDRVLHVFTTINRNTLRRVTHKVLEKCEKCVENGGRHVP